MNDSLTPTVAKGIGLHSPKENGRCLNVGPSATRMVGQKGYFFAVAPVNGFVFITLAKTIGRSVFMGLPVVGLFRQVAFFRSQAFSLKRQGRFALRRERKDTSDYLSFPCPMTFPPREG